ncbi:hypothetical protein LGM63_12230 [Burkholderia cepacia]|uniref:hypothetical protein n=1 Tax=Burkholderia cepacia TaxID=292 RepID=UPI001CF2662E|nr:hypothetical protein [Burkholderia cepacia]MCA7991406.1 hypothetical protein [Burkholderia cepacia]
MNKSQRYIFYFSIVAISTSAWCSEGKKTPDSNVDAKIGEPFVSEELPLTKESMLFLDKLVVLLRNPDWVGDINKFSNQLGLTYDRSIPPFDLNSQEAQIRTDISNAKYSSLKNIEYRMPVSLKSLPERRVVLSAEINVQNICISRSEINKRFGYGETYLSSDQWWDGDKSPPWPIGYRFQEAYRGGQSDIMYSPVVLTYYPSGCLAGFQIQKNLKSR